MKIFNLAALVSVEIRDREETQNFKYKPASNGTFWTKGLSGGFYFPFDIQNPYSAEDLRNGKFEGMSLIVEGRNVYLKPYVKLCFANKQFYTKTFDTYEEAKAWGIEQADKGMDVQLIIN